MAAPTHPDPPPAPPVDPARAGPVETDGGSAHAPSRTERAATAREVAGGDGAGAAGSPGVRAPGAEVPADRRLKSERRTTDRRQARVPVEVERRRSEDRRQVERRAPRNMNGYELGPDELELIHAVNAHKSRTGRAFPTWSEMLQIVRSLGYEKRR